MERKSGILMHISSLPNKYGIGSFGKEAIKFSEMLKEMGIKYWQTLPFGTIDSFNSPYKSFSAFAGNPYFIDLETLYEKKLLTEEELRENEYKNPYAVDFNWLRDTRFLVFEKAYNRIDENYKIEISKFVKENAWVEDFALYMAIREKNNNKDWYDWEEDLKFHKKSAIEDFKISNEREISFYEFLQYEFYSQWENVKKEINKNGIQMIGDIPIYVSLESSDVWSNRKLFELSEEGKPKLVAGVPPDYFSEEGQKWGNPLYDWKAMKKQNYKWWIDRIGNSLKLFDKIRIDHFRGFSAYWGVPSEAKTAKEGSWIKGPRMDMFNVVLKKFEKSQIIAEDLGVIDSDVVKLLEKTKFPGMRVMQFGFLGDRDSMHLPHNYERNIIAYTGTHDNNTLLGWLWELSEENRKLVLEYCGFNGEDWGTGGFDSKSCKCIIKTLWASVASIVIVPIQDLCGFGSDTKMNAPGKAEGNWSFRISEEALNSIDKIFVKELNETYRR